MQDRKLPVLAMVLLVAITAIFGGAARSSEQPFDPAAITLLEAGELKELVDESLRFVDPNNVEWTAPKGTLTDGASVPRLLLPITDGRWDSQFLKAAVLHDCYCQTDNVDRCRGRYRTRPWQQVHRMFYDACIAGGTHPVLAGIMYSGVRLGGPRWPEAARSLANAPAAVLNLGFTAVKAWIEKNEPTIEEIEADLERREPLLLELHERDVAISAALWAGDLGQAQDLLGEQEQLLRQQFEQAPDDLMLINFNGHRLKDSAILQRMSGAGEEAAVSSLRESEAAFQTILEFEPREPSALKGLANVSMMRGDLLQAQDYERRALEIAPSYDVMKDLEAIERLSEGATPP